MSVEKVQHEIIAWHQFLHGFFRGEIPAAAFNRMNEVLTPEFKYVTVWGEVVSQKAFMEQVPQAYGIFPDLDVYVENIEVQEIGPDLYLTTFEQVETFPDLPARRTTSAILRMDDGIAKWVLFHLTFIDPTKRPQVNDE